MDKPKIVILDGYTLNPGDLSYDSLKDIGEVTAYDRSLEEEVKDRIKDADIVITNKSKVRKEAIDFAGNLRGVFVLATGYDCTDYEYLKEKNIGVYNVPTYGTDTVAEFTFAQIMELTKGVARHSEDVKKGGWIETSDFSYTLQPIMELKGKTLGIIGYGNIGRRVGELALAFGMKLLILKHRYEDISEDDNVSFVSLEELLKSSDIVTLHCPLYESTRGIINKDTLSVMKNSAYLINSSRGPLVVEEDLKEALNNDIIAGACVDVLNVEPMESNNPLMEAKNIFITPHIAWSTREARVRILKETVLNIEAFLKGEERNRVNK